MKKHHLIFLTTAIFTWLFYEQSVGLNLGIFGLVLSLLVYLTTDRALMNRTFYALFAASIGSSTAFAWYGDFVSFLAVFLSLSLLVFRSRTAYLKPVFSLIVIPLNAFTFIVRVFYIREWLPKSKADANFWKRIFAYLIVPLALTVIFFLAYSLGSEHFANLFVDWKWNIHIGWVILTAMLGFYLMFNLWNYSASDFLEKQSRLFRNDFVKTPDTEKSTLSFMDVSMERTSGIISFVCLNVLLLIYVITFNYEQFFEYSDISNLKSETHERVNAVILSIIMAIILIMFYFKGGFNFDKKAKSLKTLAIIWIALNAALVFSAFIKNTQYIWETDLLTYKRLGVYAFLILALVGLFYTFVKIQKRKANAFLFNRMFWYFYGVVLVCSFINWGEIITRYNITKPNFDVNYHLSGIDFNERFLIKQAEEKGDTFLENVVSNRIDSIYNNDSNSEKFLSKKLYYEGIR
ncbi:hypothetical protein FACS1894182_03220 [Bacteroidia bacterium]|nr:hypothetical protein FACS1894182_03220 [Bacteroidia bacterium]